MSEQVTFEEACSGAKTPTATESPGAGDCAAGGNNGGITVDANVGGSDSLVSADVGVADLVNISADVGGSGETAADDYSGISLEVAALADSGLLSVDADVPALDSLIGDLGGIGLPDLGGIGLPDLGGILDPATCA